MPPATANIPVIDLAGDEADVARQLVAAAEEHGFIYIKNRCNDIPAAAVDEAFSLVRKNPGRILSRNEAAHMKPL